MLPLRDNVPTRRFPVVTVALIAANVLVWVLYQLPDLQGSVDELAYHPCEVEGSCPTVGQGWLLTALTSMFMHGSWAHLLGNMLFLWIFGDNVEARLGKIGYLASYLATGALATLTFAVLAPKSTVPLVGASGAISGVLGFYLIWFPFNQVRVLFVFFFIHIFYLRAIWWIGWWGRVRTALACTPLRPGSRSISRSAANGRPQMTAFAW